MTAQEAIRKIDDVLSSEYHYDETLGYQLTSDDFEWLEKAKQSLEKQMPKKPVKSKQDNHFHCPNCNASRYINILVKYCPFCGRALDWSDGQK